MMNIYSVTFIGHRDVERFKEVEAILEGQIRLLLQTKEYVEFYVGNDGEFDTMAVSALRRVRREYGDENSAVNLVLPYKKANMDLLAMQFDTVTVPDELYGGHPKRAITMRNQWVVDHSDLLICYVTRATGGRPTP